MSFTRNESTSSSENEHSNHHLDHSTVDVQVRIFSSSMASRRSGQENSAPLTADLTIRLPPVQHNGSRNHSAARMPITDGNTSTTKTQQRPCPAIGEAGATLNPGWHPTDTGGRVCNNPSNYANRRRSPSPSIRKSPAISHQPTNLTMGITQQHRPNNFSSARSTYHAGCQHTSQSRIPVYQLSTSSSSPSATRSFTFHQQQQPLELLIPAVRPPQRFSYHNPAVAAMAAASGRMDDGQWTSKHVTNYLKANRGFLEHHVLEHVDAATLERWYMRRVWREKAIKPSTIDNPTEEMLCKKISMSKWKFCRHTDKRQMLETLMNSLAKQPQPGRILWELACCVASSVGADGFILHLAHPQTGVFRIFRSCDIETDIDNGIFDSKIYPDFSASYDYDRETAGSRANFYSVSNKDRHNVASYVAKHRHTITVRDIRRPDSRFEDGSICLQEGGVHVLGAPVVQNDGTLTGVIELYRRPVDNNKSSRGPFQQDDEEVVSSFLVWGGIALHYADMYHALANQRNLHQFLLTVVKSIFQDMVSMDTVIAKVMTFAQKLVDADRASLFLVDHKSNELYARIFDMGDGVGDGQTPAAAKEIRFPLGTGIAGQVAVTGKVLNIPDAYLDSRFNRAVDQQTGYHTTSILCMPIFIQGQVIGVMQMVNKHHGTFTAEDEESFELFAVYCGLALHHTKLYDRIIVSEQKYRVTLEVLSYHNCCTESEFNAIQQLNNSTLEVAGQSDNHFVQQNVTSNTIGLDQFWFSAFGINDMEKVHNAVYMFVDLFGLGQFEQDSLIRFMLTVRKNYRRVPYHNWTHGFAVANSMYVILKRAPNTFKPLEAVALFVSALCHDLDHRGKNNKFMLDTASPLAAIYTTSTMEHHHFNQTVIILQQEGHNILGKLKSDEFKEVLRNIKHCILATDLALFFPNRAKLTQIVEEDQFTWENKDHRLLVQAIAMTGSDLCASSKPWDVQSETVKVIFEEFYEQGDEEKKAGRTPIPMMDRNQLHLQPDSQVGFISGICIPCYNLLYRLIPETKPLLDGCQSNMERWKQLAKDNERVENDHANGAGKPRDDGSTEIKDSKHLPSLTRAISLPIRSYGDLDSHQT
ncbi:probable 3',5'-cyclic phosphodiesterase pde-5 isoform X1 [Daphnia magna]|uniref:probable 3',5'-cyclic phosphodiesterase pde-5 isoform X1 n=1 Tax=Daphnia magna TaxID=35525 RepID=UPI001E1BBB9A|nr:probable 3',5'-cyclic phosphodiesterase pde-5 isoform X1 [Daphnia magna]XP_045028639.1 probable 3',5'-cyclic phosphodiesterase pde-5 isoform X1 [Daphnia magna]XP_045028640.1 probable 3',5'-cyclic phosphodiesterase pde-5 isoform X1 [Daphnia magna]